MDLSMVLCTWERRRSPRPHTRRDTAGAMRPAGCRIYQRGRLFDRLRPARSAPAEPWRSSTMRILCGFGEAGGGVATVEAAALPAAAVGRGDVVAGLARVARERRLESAAVGTLLVGGVDAALFFAQPRPPLVAGSSHVDSAGGGQCLARALGQRVVLGERHHHAPSAA